ncbi:MAG: EamA family transporter [Pseudomonadota bacterium]
MNTGFLLAIFSTVIPSFMITEAINRIGPTQTGIVGTLGPIFTIALAIYLLNEPFSLTILAGIIMVISGVMILIYKKTD